ncbi:MAG: thioesterase family protein, partial [Pseudomonadota bacterium]
TWDCDEMGHMNVRVYVEKAMEGLARLAYEIDMPHAFREASPSTLLPVDQHIRFLNEVHPGKPLSMSGCVVDMGAGDAVIYQDLRHADGTPAAAFRTRVQHARSGSGEMFPWSRRTQAALEAQIDTPPADTAPRSIQPDAPTQDTKEISLTAAKSSGAPRIGMGCVPPQHCDIHGRMQTQWFMGRISDSVPNLLSDWRARIAEEAGNKSAGAAVLEYRLIYHRWPRAGDAFDVYSSLAGAAEKTHSLVHWMVDPVSGLPWMTSKAVAATFDLKTRRIIPTQPDHIDALRALAPGDLSI